jgi:haloalkane dehalogenase
VLLFTFEPGFLMTPEIQAWAEDHIKDLRVEHLGSGIHWVQEDQPEAIAASITAWLQKLQ